MTALFSKNHRGETHRNVKFILILLDPKVESILAL
jgi:hypothetical protein